MSILIPLIHLTSAFTFLLVAASLCCFLCFERPVLILGDDNALHIKHQPVWRCNICQLRVEERKVLRLQLLEHTRLSGG